MQCVPVVSSTGQPLMPCHPARARELVRRGRAARRFNRGLFYIRLLDRDHGQTQEVAVGIDPGSKKEAFTVKSESHTFLNVQADAVTWVGRRIEQRKMLRQMRRGRKVRHRANRKNRSRGGLPPSTRARWQWKIRLSRWICSLYPVSHFVIEDISARSTGRRRWDRSFGPLQNGKRWFYKEIAQLAPVTTRHGWETKSLRDAHGLSKSSSKLSDRFDAHCVDSWVLANSWTGGHTKPDNTVMLFIVPLQLHRRQLHYMQPTKGGSRRPYGGTRSLGFKRGSWVRHIKHGLCYVGGTMKDRITLHSMETGKRLTQRARPADCQFLTYASWRIRTALAHTPTH